MAVVTEKFYLEVKAGLGATLPDSDWLVFCKSWQTAEGGDATHNPFNVTLPLPGSTNYNRVPVQNYISQAQGVHATVQVLQQLDHGPILNGMKSNADPYYLAAQIGQSDWGTDLVLFVEVLADNYNFGASRPVAK